MDLSLRTETFGQDDQSWLGSAHGTDNAVPVTLDKSLFTSGTHFPDGYFKSGIALGKVTATGKYGPYDDAASDGRQVAVGLLFTSVPVRTSADIDPVGAMLLHCFVRTANLPIAIDAAGKADVAGRIIFI